MTSHRRFVAFGGGVNDSRLLAGVGLLLPAAICLAALSAHVAIDVVGDWALPRDAYDALGHDSRTLVALTMACITVAACLRFVLAALDRGPRPARERRIGRFLPRSPVGFAATIFGGSVAVVIAMETLDSLASTGRIESLADAFGGSVLLGIAVVAPIALAVAALAWCALRWFTRAKDDMVRIIATLFAVRVRPRAALACAVSPGITLVSRERASAARRAGKRGPPLLASYRSLR